MRDRLEDLFLGARFERDDDTFRELVQKHPELILLVDEWGDTLLHHSARSLERVRVILVTAEENGLLGEVIEARNATGKTPLAQVGGRADVALELLSQGADPLALDDAGEPAIAPDSSLRHEIDRRLAGTLLTSLDQLAAVTHPEIVTEVVLHDVAEFPARVLEFVNLEKLSISTTSDLSECCVVLPDLAGLRKLRELSYFGSCEVGEWLGDLEVLERINLQPAALPESVGRLQHLNVLNVSFGTLSSLPESLGQLRTLQYLNIRNTEITSLPSSIGDLVSLRSIDAMESKLTDLPDSLAKLESLEEIELDGTPFHAVPEVLYRLDGVRRTGLEEAPGFRGWARAAAQTATDGEVLFARSRPVLLSTLEGWLEDCTNSYPEFARCGEGFRHIARAGMALVEGTPSAYQTLGTSRIGGRPDLVDQSRPAGPFLAQLNLEELAPFQDYLPRTGLLSFYMDDRAVTYAPDLASLTHTDDAEPAHDAFDLFADACFSVPHFYNDHWALIGPAAPLAALEELDLSIEHDLPEGHHHVNGYAFSQSAGPHVAAATEHGGLPMDWVILLRVADRKDVGDLAYFMIHRDDLLAANFGAAHVVVEPDC